MEKVNMYPIHKKCPECGNFNAKVWNENRKIKEDVDWNKPMEEHSITYRVITHYTCKECNHRWMK